MRTAAAAVVLSVASSLAQAGNDWPSYNRTLTSDRYATLEKIDNKNVAGLKVLCSFDTGEQISFQTGLVPGRSERKSARRCQNCRAL